MRKRKSPYAKSLIKNSVSAILAAVEIHNKPIFSFRYEVSIVLFIVSWELALKAYIYKHQKNVKLFRKDGTTKPFDECLECVSSSLGKSFHPVRESILRIYEYRNNFIHFYSDKLDPIIYSLLKPNLIFLSRFLKEYFSISLENNTDMELLPIGFRKPFSPVDFVGNRSALDKASHEARAFIKNIVESSQNLLNENINESILIDYRIALINESRVKNADIVAGVNNAIETTSMFSVKKQGGKMHLSKDENAPSVRVTRNKEESKGVLVHEELSEGIFDEINNIIEANSVLAKGTNRFLFDHRIYFRLYAERQYIDKNQDVYSMLFKTSLLEIYSPILYWLLHLSPPDSGEIISEFAKNPKAPNVNSLLRILTLLGDKALDWFGEKLEGKWKGHPQPPDFYYAFSDIRKRKYPNQILKALRTTAGTKLDLPNKKSLQIKSLLNDPQQASKLLSECCIAVFEGNKSYRSSARILDVIAHAELLETQSEQIMKFLK